MKHQFVEVELRVTLKIRLPSDDLLPAQGPYCKASMIQHELRRWEASTIKSTTINPHRTDPGPVHMSVRTLP
jgi:hypothetical protein